MQSQFKDISLDGCEFLARGFVGECFKIDEERVLKLYYEHIKPELVLNEKRFAKEAFVLGVPTAISFEVVKHDNRVGVVYEMLNAANLNRLLNDNPQRTEEYAAMFSDISKIIHSTKGMADIFPKAKDLYRFYVNAQNFTTDEEKQILLRIIEGIPDEGTCIHGDLHAANVMIDRDGPKVIDMGDFSIGTPWCDVGHAYNIYYEGAYNGVSKHVAGMDKEEALAFWKAYVDAYFHGPDEEKKADILRRARVFSLLKLFQVAYVLNNAENIIGQIRAYLPELREMEQYISQDGQAISKI